MTAVTHYAFSYLVTSTAGISPGVALVTSLVSLIPDIDHPESIAGRLCPSLSRRIMQKYGHRTITHSVFSVLAVSIISIPVFFLPNSLFNIQNSQLYISLVLAYSSHIFIDLFNRAGVKLLAPVTQKEYISFRTPALRILVRSWQEYALLFVIVFLAFTVTGEAFSMGKAVRSTAKLFYRNYDGALTDYEHASKNICTAKVEYFDAVQSKIMNEEFIVLTMFPENAYMLRYDSTQHTSFKILNQSSRIILKKDIINEIEVTDTAVPRKQTHKSGSTLRDLAALPADSILSGSIVLKNYQPVLRNSDYIRVSHSPTATTITLICAMTGELGEIIALEKMRNAVLETLKAKQSSFQIARLTAEKQRLEASIKQLSLKGFYAQYNRIMAMNSEVKKIESRIDSLRMREVSGADADTSAKIEQMESAYAVEYDIWMTEL